MNKGIVKINFKAMLPLIKLGKSGKNAENPLKIKHSPVGVAVLNLSKTPSSVSFNTRRARARTNKIKHIVYSRFKNLFWNACCPYYSKKTDKIVDYLCF